MSPITFDLLNRLPKVELHCHLDGCLRPQSMLEVAKQDGISLPYSDIMQLDSYLRIGKKRGTLEDYLKLFDITLSVMQTPESLVRFAYELIEDVAQENVRYIEVRYSPILHTKHGMTLKDAIESVLKGLKKGKKDTI